MPAALAAIAGRLLASEAAGGTYALAGEGAAGVGPAIPGAASASKQAANSLLSVTQNLKKTDAAAKEAAKGGGGYLKHLQEVHQTYQQATGKLNLLANNAAAAGVAITSGLTAGITAIQALADPIANLTGLANPAALDAFSRAVNDDFAVVGRALLPVTEAFTRLLQKLGTYLAGAEPILNSVAQAFGRMIDQLGDEWLDALRESAPVMEALASALVDVAKEAAVAGRVVLFMAKLWNQAAGQLFKLLGFSGSSFNPNASAKGAAVRDVRAVSSAERVATEAQERALKQALNPGQPKEPPEVRSANYLSQIAGGVADIVLAKDTIIEILKIIARIKDAPKEVATAAATGLDNFIKSIFLRG